MVHNYAEHAQTAATVVKTDQHSWIRLGHGSLDCRDVTQCRVHVFCDCILVNYVLMFAYYGIVYCVL